MQWFAAVAVMIGILLGWQAASANPGVTIKVAQSISKPSPPPGVVRPSSPISKTRSVVREVKKKTTGQVAKPASGQAAERSDEQTSKSAEAVQVQATYRYDAQDRRDPFESMLKEKIPVVDVGPVIDDVRQREPLEHFDLASLQLMGIIWGELGRRAVIRAPDNKGYFVTVGMYMGQNGGQVVAVENDRLVIKEKHRNMKGNVIDKILTIPLRRKEHRG